MSEPKLEIRDQRKGNWIWTQKAILFSPFVGASEYKVYAGLCSFADNQDQSAWPSYNTLAEKLNMGRMTVHRSLKNLIALGVILKEARKGTSNVYTLIDVEEVKAPVVAKSKSEHHRLISFFYDMTEKTRGFKPAFSTKDVSSLKRVLNTGVLSESDIEKVMVYFLANRNFVKFSPSLSVVFSAGILNGIVNKLKNDHAFTKEVSEYAQTHVGISPINEKGLATLAEQIEKLKQRLSIRV